VVQKERKGYAPNRWLTPLPSASLALVADRVSTPEDVDRAIWREPCSPVLSVRLLRSVPT
jgi:3-hydroxyacyl-CoA dehydrogenase